MGDNDSLPAGTEFRLQQFFEVLEHAGNINNIFQDGLEKTFNMHDRMSKGNLAGVHTSSVGDVNKKPWFEVVDGDNLSKIAKANNMTLDELLEKNPEYKENPNFVRSGATLNL